jgi:hypothetical protein
MIVDGAAGPAAFSASLVPVSIEDRNARPDRWD